MKPSDIKSAPKILCESVNVGYTKEFFVASLNSGDEADFFAFSPQHMKRLAQYLGHQIKDYEKEHGEINANWKPEIVSPVQRVNPPSDLS